MLKLLRRIATANKELTKIGVRVIPWFVCLFFGAFMVGIFCIFAADANGWTISLLIPAAVTGAFFTVGLTGIILFVLSEMNTSPQDML